MISSEEDNNNNNDEEIEDELQRTLIRCELDDQGKGCGGEGWAMFVLNHSWTDGCEDYNEILDRCMKFIATYVKNCDVEDDDFDTASARRHLLKHSSMSLKNVLKCVRSEEGKEYHCSRLTQDWELTCEPRKLLLSRDTALADLHDLFSGEKCFLPDWCYCEPGWVGTAYHRYVKFLTPADNNDDDNDKDKPEENKEDENKDKDSAVAAAAAASSSSDDNQEKEEEDSLDLQLLKQLRDYVMVIANRATHIYTNSWIGFWEDEENWSKTEQEIFIYFQMGESIDPNKYVLRFYYDRETG